MNERETLEEHSEQLRIESERISALNSKVQQLEKIVVNLAKTVEIYGNVLPNVQTGYPYWSSDNWKKLLNVYSGHNDELRTLVRDLSAR